MLEIITKENEEEVIPLCYKFYQESPYSTGDFQETKVRELFSTLVSDKENAIIIGYREQGTLVGIIALLKSQMLFSYEYNVGELMWYVLPEYRKGRAGLKLLEAGEYWAKNVSGAEYMTMVHLDNDRLSKLYEKKGFSKKEEAYMKEL